MKKLGENTFYDLYEIADEFCVSERTLRRYIYSKKLNARKIGCGWYVSDEALRDFFKQPEKLSTRSSFDQEIQDNSRISF